MTAKTQKLLLAVLLLQISESYGKDFVHYSGHNVTFSTRAVEKDRTLICRDKHVKPYFHQVWYGLVSLGTYERCSDVPGEISRQWHDATLAFNTECALRRGQGCRIPSFESMKSKRNELETYWLLCYECTQGRHGHNTTKRYGNRPGDNDDDPYAFHPPRRPTEKVPEEYDQPWERDPVDWLSNKRDQDLSERQGAAEKFALGTIGRRLNSFVNDISGRSDLVQEAELFMTYSEDTAGTLTNILNDDESMDLTLDGFGTMTLQRSSSSKDHDVKVITSEATERIGLDLRSQASLMNEDNSTVTSLVVFDDEVSSVLRSTGGSNVTSQIIAVTSYDSQGKVRQRKLERPIRFVLEHGAVPEDYEAKCVFWDFDLSDWSSEGCAAESTEGNLTTCACEHLTNFAVILDIIPYQQSHQKLLRLLTLVCCSLSVLGLAGAVFYFAQHRGNELNDRVRINLHFCSNLLIVQLLMIFGIGQTQWPGVCMTVGIFLHYFLMATFTWSLLSGHQIYVLLVEVFDSEEKRMRYYYLLGYGLPLVLVFLSLVIDASFFGLETYGTEDYCWMRPNADFYLTFLAPLSFVLFVNLSMLALVIVKVYRIQPRPHMFGQARGWFSLAVLLGATWAVGLLAKVYPSLFVAVVFVVLNSLQGLLIFLFQVVLGQRCKARISREYHSRFKDSDYFSPSKKQTSETSAGPQKSTSVTT